MILVAGAFLEVNKFRRGHEVRVLIMKLVFFKRKIRYLSLFPFTSTLDRPGKPRERRWLAPRKEAGSHHTLNLWRN